MKVKYKELADEAHNFLEKETPYIQNKRLIKSVFQLEFCVENIKLQLALIDSLYSTNMSKRYFGIEDIANELFKFNSKQQLINEFNSFIQNPQVNSEIDKLFKMQYGINKSGKNSGLAVSLISKYAYFITDCNFPIYDSLVRIVMEKMGEDTTNKDIIKFISFMRNFNTKHSINDFNKLDNLFWLLGKVIKNKYSIILEKDTFLNCLDIISNFKIQESNIKEFSQKTKVPYNILNWVKNNN